MQNEVILLCGKYKGIDERIIKNNIDIELSIGDFIITSGELAAIMIIDATTRLMHGLLTKSSIEKNSFNNILFDYPNYTKPKTIYNLQIPKILLTGNHKMIKNWRLKQSMIKTWKIRPDLIKSLNGNNIEKLLLKNFIKTWENNEKYNKKNRKYSN